MVNARGSKRLNSGYRWLEPIGQTHRADQLLVPGNGEAVGHSGDEVADGPQLLDLAPAAAPWFGQQIAIVAVRCGEASNDPLRLLADLLELGGFVEPSVEEAFQSALLLGHCWREADERPARG